MKNQKRSKVAAECRNYEKITKNFKLDKNLFAIDSVLVTQFSSTLGINFYYIKIKLNFQNYNKI